VQIWISLVLHYIKITKTKILELDFWVLKQYFEVFNNIIYKLHAGILDYNSVLQLCQLHHNVHNFTWVRHKQKINTKIKKWINKINKTERLSTKRCKVYIEKNLYNKSYSQEPVQSISFKARVKESTHVTLFAKTTAV